MHFGGMAYIARQPQVIKNNPYMFRNKNKYSSKMS